MTFRVLRRQLLWAAVAATVLCGAGPLQAADAEIAPLAGQSLLLDGQAIGSTLIAVGERGHILTSHDAGRSWQQRPAPTRATLTSVFFTDVQHGWAAGHDAVILRTTDGGTTWQKVHEDFDSEPVLDLWFRDASTGYALGAYGLCLATRDGGITWESLTISDETGTDTDLHLNQLRALADGRLIIAAESGRLLLSADHGHTWKILPSPYEGSLFGTLPFDNDRLLAYGLRGHIFLSPDGGRSWRPIATGTEAILNDAIRLRDGRLIVVGLAGTVLISSDNGEHFTLRQQPDRAGFVKAVEAADGALILLGAQGTRRLEPTAAGGLP